MSANQAKRPFFARTVRLLAIPLVIAWALFAITTNTFVPKVEDVATELAGPEVPTYAPSQYAMLHIGEKFRESNSTSLMMVVLEADHSLSPQDQRYYNDLVRRLKGDIHHVQYVMDLWGSPVTAAGAQSIDAKATYVLLRLAGNVGQLQANQSVDAVRAIVAKAPPPQGLKAYVSGAAPMASDTLSIANDSLNNIAIVTIGLILVMLLLVYRSLSNVAVPMYSVLFEILIARGVISALGHYGFIPISSFAVNIVISLVLGAGTDYGIFLMGRYHEARLDGESREDAFYTAYRGVAPIIIGSGLTIAGSCFCLTFSRLDYFHTMGPAVAISMLFTIAAALTLGPALLTLGSLFGLFDPKKVVRGRLYRRIGASVVRWPKPILAASMTVVLLGAIFVPSYSVSYDDRAYQPSDAPANLGFAASDRHFTPSKLFTEMMMVESDHDMRTSADFISLDRVAKEVVRLPGVAMVQSVTRPLGRPLDHANVPYLFTVQGGAAGQQLPFAQHQNDNTDRQAKIQARTVETLGKTIDIAQRLSDALHSTRLTLENLHAVTEEINEDISNLDDFLRPLKSYYFWDKHCFDIPVCWSFRSLFNALDGIDGLEEQIGYAVTDIVAIDALLPQLVTQLTVLRDETQSLQAIVVNTYGPSHLQATQTGQTYYDQVNVGNDFDTSRSDDYFYLPREGFDNEDVKTDMRLMMSPDGKAARFIITHDGDALGPEGVDHVNQLPGAVKAALKETSLAGAKIFIGGAASNDKDIHEYATSDLTIVAIAAFVLIFLIMLVLTRSLIAAMVIPGTVAFSFAGAFGLSILVWQRLIGLHLHWLVLPITFVVLVAVGSDYNLLLIARVKEEIGVRRQTAGLHTGLIRALGSTGGVVTSAGLVFAFTMLAMLSSDLKTIAQVGSTVCIGLLLDTLIVRSFVVPALIRLLGPWFWWPALVRTRPRLPTDVLGGTR